MHGQIILILGLLWSSQATAFLPPLALPNYYPADNEEVPHPVPLEAPEALSEAPHLAEGCIITIQVTKKLVGHCMNLGRKAKGCVSGTMLHPYHPDC